MDSRFDDICKFLQSQGYSVYAPGAKKGYCDKPYIVVKPTEGVKVLSISTFKRYYEIMCYAKTISQVEELKERLRDSMKALFPMLNPTFNETRPYFDDGVKGWMTSLEYINYRKIEY